MAKTSMNTSSSYDQKQIRYFSRVRYRSADDPVVRAYAAPKIDLVRKAIPLSRQSRILDLACGNGVFTYHLSRISDFTVALDLSPHLLRQNPFGHRVCSDANVLPFADDSFDVVFEANLLHHVPSRDSVIEQMKRVSRRHLVFVEPNRLNPLMFLFSLAVPEERGVRKSSGRLLKGLLERAGLRTLS
ncbi:MAG: class I SAM-dependent methyltransferase, partial [Bryobacteraceae bacterium]